MRINALLAWLDSSFNNFDTQDPINPALGVQDLSGNELSRAPEWKFSLGAQYSGSLAGEGELNARIDDQYYRAY